MQTTKPTSKTVVSDNLHIHLNTLYYRQEKLSELFSVDFAELETKIVLYHELFHYDFARFRKECEAGS